MVTGLIIYAIWNTVQSPARESNTILPTTTHLLWSVTAVLVESGVLYLVVQLVFVVLTALNHPAQETVAMMAVQIYVSQQSALDLSIRMHFLLTSCETPGNCTYVDSNPCCSRNLCQVDFVCSQRLQPCRSLVISSIVEPR